MKMKKDIITTAKKGIEECYFQHHIKLITPLKTDKNHNIFLIDKNTLFQIHQWGAVTSTKLKTEKCEIKLAEYSPFIYNAIVRVYDFDKIVFHEEYEQTNDSQPKALKYWIEVIFKGVSIIIELNPEKICPVYTPPKPKRRKRRKRKKL